MAGHPTQTEGELRINKRVECVTRQSPPTCHLRFAHDMVSEFPSLLPRGVTVAQVTLDHFVMVRIHARQVIAYEAFTRFALNPDLNAWTLLNIPCLLNADDVIWLRERHSPDRTIIAIPDCDFGP